MILLTRPFQDSTNLAKILGEETCLVEPMMEIKQLSFQIKDSCQAIVKTSKNTNHKADIYIPEHGKNANEILEYCLQNLLPENGKIIYLSGDNITLDIAEELQKNGFDAEKIIAYKQISTKEFSNEFLMNFEGIKIAIFFSNQTIKNFLHLSEKHNLNLKNIICVCISENVSRETNMADWKDIKIATTPNLNGMLDAINAIA